MNKVRCQNMNHGRSNASVSFCPSCGERLNRNLRAHCDNTKHAIRRKDRSLYCHDCGLKLSQG